MDRTISEFVKALRMSDVRVSPTETMDALHTVEAIGYADRQTLKNALSLVLPKSPEEKEVFDVCFDRFFTFDRFREARKDAPGEDEGSGSQGPDDGDDSAPETPPEGQGDGEGGGGGGESGGERHVPSEGASGPGGSGAPEPADEAASPGAAPDMSIPLVRMLMEDDRTGLALAMTDAARTVGLSDIRIFTQKGLFARRIQERMGLTDLLEEISRLDRIEDPDAHEAANTLRHGRSYLSEEVRDFVEQQFSLHADVEGRQLREEILSRIKLTNVERRDYRHVQEIVRRMAKRLVALYSRRRKVTKRGQLDIRKTMRKNVAYDGLLFDTYWKSTKVDRPQVFAICDVSGSVSKVAHFMLMFLYSLNEVLPRVRSFAFSSHLGEVTELFERADIEEAMTETLARYGRGSTDYGQALMDFRDLCLDDIDNRTTVIILGDGRSNYGDPRHDILKLVHDRAKRVMWLNPEPRDLWNYGDAVMRKFVPYCHQAEVCNSLTHLERIVSHLLRTVR